jgi:acetylornithine deacetylase/succinyl-diaminopimelate desuccinylase-like protein
MADRVSHARSAARKLMPAALQGLDQWLRIPSVSGDPAHRTDVAAAADWIAKRLVRLTKDVRTVTAAQNPVVVARIPGRGEAGTILVYGHLDVKAPGPGWTSRPFEPLRRGDMLIARGASDDKGQLMAHIAAVEAWASIGGPPGPVVVVVDGAEEIGSPGLASALRRCADLVRGPITAVVVSDTKMVGPGKPSLTESQRGMLGLNVRASTHRAAVHAGRYGGAVVDPTLALATAILRASRTAEELGCGDIRRPEGATTCGALSVTSFHSGTAPGSIPPTAKATLDVRLPAGVEPAVALPKIAGALRRNAIPRGEVEVTCVSASTGVIMRQTPIVREAVDRACRLAFGRPAVAVSSGGSIPAVATLMRISGRPPILLGLGPVDDGAHGPDEHLRIDDWIRGVDASVCLIGSLSNCPSASITRRGSNIRTRLIARGSRGAAAPGGRS